MRKVSCIKSSCNDWNLKMNLINQGYREDTICVNFARQRGIMYLSRHAFKNICPIVLKVEDEAFSEMTVALEGTICSVSMVCSVTSIFLKINKMDFRLLGPVIPGCVWFFKFFKYSLFFCVYDHNATLLTACEFTIELDLTMNLITTDYGLFSCKLEH